ARQEARGEAVGLGLVGAVVAVGEQAAGLELALFLEAVPAAAGGQGELAELVAPLPEDRGLLDVVGQVGVVGRVGPVAVGDGRGGPGAQGGVGGRIVARRRQALVIGPLDVG